MTDIRRLSPTGWEWRVGNKGYGVRIFAGTRRLIYSSWTDTANGPVFDDGVAQTYEQFLFGEPLPFDVPIDVLKEIREVIDPPQSGKRWSGRMRKRK